MARTRGADFFSTEITVQMSATSLDAQVLSTAGSPASPTLLVIDHDVPAKRELILFDGVFDGTTFRTTSLTNRYLPNSAAASGIVHDVGANVIFAALGSHHEEIHDELDAHEAASAVHGAVSAATANTIVRRDASGRFRAADPSNSADVATKAYADAAIPVGGIIMWSGSVGSIPTRWQLCDGTNGTPNLRGRFVIGAGGSYSPGETGGSVSHSHSGPSHTHASANHSHGINEAGAHSHGGSTGSGSDDRHVDVSAGSTNDNFAIHTHSIPSEGPHTHGGSTNSTTPGSTGSSGNASTGSSSTLPSYYALCYIQRVS